MIIIILLPPSAAVILLPPSLFIPSSLVPLSVGRRGGGRVAEGAPPSGECRHEGAEAVGDVGVQRAPGGHRPVAALPLAQLVRAVDRQALQVAPRSTGARGPYATRRLTLGHICI